jgi:hypothetical protein
MMRLENTLYVVCREQSSTMPTFKTVLFPRVEVLRELKPAETHRNLLEIAEWRTRRANEFNRKQAHIALGKRRWLRLTEIADEYARNPGSLEIDEKRREHALQALRSSILAEEFGDRQSRSRVLNMHPSRHAGSRFDPLGATNPDQFDQIAAHLWITHQDCVEWFNRSGIELPHRLRREVEPLYPKDDRCDHEEKGGAKVGGRQRVQERPVGRYGRPIIKTAAWDAIGSHDEWGSNGIPQHWTERVAGNRVNTHLRKLIKQGKLHPADYDGLKPNSEGKYEISPDSVERVLVPRRRN